MIFWKNRKLNIFLICLHKSKTKIKLKLKEHHLSFFVCYLIYLGKIYLFFYFEL